MVGGSGRFDTRVMERFGERVCCKVGAEGMFCAALPQQGLGIAIKMDDGNNSRACEVLMAALIESFIGPISDAERALLQSLSEVPLLNRRGIEIGRLTAHEIPRPGDKRLPGAQNRTAA
jgi:L-asparaginase II